jgi:hypothetical protein
VLDRLAELLPPPADVEPTDWAPIERRLGTPLPPDYKAFCDRWGRAGDIESDTFGPVSVYRQPDEARDFGSVLRQMRDVDGTIEGLPLFPEPEGLLSWGGTESRVNLLWRTAGAPSEWEVVLFDIAPVRTGLPFVEWLVAALERDLPQASLPPELWPADGEEDAPPEWFPR